LVMGTPADYHRPGFSDAGPKVRSWMPQLGQDGNPRRRRLVEAFAAFGASCRHLHPDGNGWNRSIWPMQSIGEMPVNIVAMSFLQNRVIAAPCASVDLRLENRPEIKGVRHLVAGNASRAGTCGFGDWQAAAANLGGRVVELGIMQPASVKPDPGNCDLEHTRGVMLESGCGR
jgi:hypothetical protein